MNSFATAVIAALALALAAVPASAQSTQRATGLQLSGDEPIEIESDRLEVRDEEGIAIFEGNVSVVQGPTLLRSGKMTVYYNTSGESGSSSAAAAGASDIDRLEVEGKVYVRSETQVATGDRGSFDMRTEVLELTGDEVVLTEGDNVIVGCRLVVQMATGLANLDGCSGGSGSGRVRMLLRPGSQNP
jgi:lipopolysaccharide export system protein LptA